MKQIVIAIFILITLISCQRANQLEIVSTNFDTNDHQIELRQNLVFIFNNAIVKDSAIHQWDTTRFIRFNPEVPGVFKWNSPNELVFSPYESFRPSTEYTASLTDRLLIGNAEKMQIADDNIYKFHTETMHIKSADVIWQRQPGSARAIMNVRINFPYAITPAAMSGLLTLKAGTDVLKYEISPDPASRTVALYSEIGDPRAMDGKTLDIRIAPGLRLADYDFATKDEMNYKLEIPSVDQLRITDVRAHIDGPEKTIRIMTNQEISKKQKLDSLIDIYPDAGAKFSLADFGIEVEGKFSPGSSYQIDISGELTGVFDKKLGEDVSANVSFGDMAPAISFASPDAIYLSSRGERNIGINISNIDKIKVTIAKIFENNILTFFRQGPYYDWVYDEKSDDYKNFKYFDYSNLGNVIFEKTYETDKLPRNGDSRLLKMNMDMLEKFDGIYVVKAESTEEIWLQASNIVSVSDIALIAKATDDNVFVMANSIKSAEPVKNAEIRLFSNTNQLMSTGRTNVMGIAAFAGLGRSIPRFRPGMVSVKKDGDVNYLVLNYDTRVGKSEFETGGIETSDYYAFFYGDRDLYRPGDTLVMAGIVRDRNMENVAGLPVRLKILLPGSKLYKQINIKTDDQGGFSTTLYLPANLITGTYTLQAYLAGNVLIATRYVHIEEFVPDRIKVDLKLDKDKYEIPGEISANIHAVNLFGPPASDRKYEMEMNLRRTLFRPKGYDEYGFAVSGDDQRSFESAQREGRTDPEGNATEKFALKEMLRNRGYFKADILAKVFDETGRTVSATQTAEVFTQNVFFGIGEFDSWVSAKSPLSIPLAAVDRKGNPAKATAVIRIIKTNWETVMRTNPHGGSQFESRKIEDIVSEKKIEINKKYVYKFTPELSGSYEIRVLIPGSEAYNSRRFYAYRSGYTSPASFEVDKEGKIDITADKDAYASGDRAKLLFKTPFDGKMLVTIECDKVYEYYNLEVSNQSASLEVRLKDEYIPNIYISAILYKPVDDGSMPLTVAYGFKPLKVEKPEYKLPLKIVAAEQVRSKSTQKIKIKTKPMRDINVTIAAVDEGILQVSGFETPDPYGYFYQQRALAIDSYTMYPFLFPELRAERHSYGYGEAADAYAKPGRLNPMSNKRFRLVAFWSGILKSNTRGEAEYSIAIPQFSGTLRIMACAYHDRAFGSAEQSMQVADPIVISPGLPRFLSPDDEAIASVMIANTEKSDKSVKISVESSGPVEFINNESKSLKIEANSEKMLEYRIRAKKSTGRADVTFKVSAGGNTYTHSTNLPVRAPVSLRKISGEGEIAAGKSKQIMIDHDFIEGSARGYITLASSPVVNQLNHLEYLVEYPHGCIEQTVSAAFPQLYFAELARAMDKSGSIEIAESRENISRAISKIQAMQLPGGGMAFWMGGGRESWWGTAYAAHFMIEARRAGYHVSQSVMDQAFNYLERKIGSAEKEVYHYQKDGHWQKREIAPREVFYSLYILALANRSDISTMNYYRSRPEMMSPDSRFMLAAAYKLAGDTRTFAEILPADFPDSESRRQSGGSFASPVRDPGIALNTLLEADPTNKRIPQMARHLSRQLASQRWLSTQDRAWGLLSLGKIAAREASPDISAEVFTGGRKIGYINKERRVFSGEIDIDKTKVSASGSGRAWYFWEAEGLPKEMDTRTEDSFIRARRQYYDANGNRINNTFAQGDLIVVEITIEALEKGVSIENIAITDLLPAGLEVENPRIRSSQALKWLKEQDDPEHFDYRDDRINIFTNLNENNSSQRFYYLARAVTRGEFSLGQIHADAMYNGEYHSYSGGGRVYVK